MISTYTGLRVDPTNLKVEDINITDIARSLSQQCRYGGHTRRHYSVAQHSVLLYRYARHVVREGYEVQLLALLHDAGEAYVPDLPRGLKYHELMTAYRSIGDAAQTIVEKAFGINVSPSDRARVKAWDGRIVNDEWAEVMHGERPTTKRVNRLGVRVTRWGIDSAEDHFLQAFAEVKRGLRR